MSKFNDLVNQTLNEAGTPAYGLGPATPSSQEKGDGYLHTQLVSFLKDRLAPRIGSGDVVVAVNLVNGLMEILSPSGRDSNLSLRDAKLKVQAAGQAAKEADPAYAKAKRIQDQDAAEKSGPGSRFD
jgi:hypothetical protein